MGRPVSAKPRRHAITHRRLWSWTLRTLRAEAELALDGTVGGPLADALLADQVARHEARLLPERLCELGRRDDDPPPCGVRHPRRGTTEDPAADAPVSDLPRSDSSVAVGTVSHCNSRDTSVSSGIAVVGTVAAPTSPLDGGSGAALTTAGTAADTGLPSDCSPPTVGSIPS